MSRRKTLTQTNTVCYSMHMKTPSDTLRDAIRKSGISNRQLGFDTGVDRIVIGRFLEGGNITAKNFDRLCIHLGLELRAKGKE